MKAVVQRFGFGTDSTLGKLYVPGTEPVWTLEDQYSEPKVPNETCIPEGTYRVELRKEGGFHHRYSERFPDIHRGMLHLQAVPGFTFILIHVGNTDSDTSGCILVGESGRMDHQGDFSIGRSSDAYRRAYPVLADAVESEDGLELEVTRRWAKMAA